MRIIRFLDGQQKWLAAVTDDEQAYRLPQADFMTLIYQARKQGISPVQLVESALKPLNKLTDDWTSLHLITPLEAPEVWAAGVTYQRSREARNYEATEGKLDAKTFYDKVYDAERPEIFLNLQQPAPSGPRRLSHFAAIPIGRSRSLSWGWCLPRMAALWDTSLAMT